MLTMSPNTSQQHQPPQQSPQQPQQPPNAKVKRSRWKFFPKNHRQSPEPTAPVAKATGGVPTSSDSTYGSSAANSGQNSENERSAQSSPAVQNELGLTSSTSLTQESSQQPQRPQANGNIAAAQPPAEPGLLSPQDALTQDQNKSHSNGDTTVTSPTIRKEVHHDPNTGTAITTIVTTTTTTTTIVGPRGTTIIEEPRAELGEGRRTPEPSSASEFVTQAINGQGDGRLQSPMGDEKSPTVPGQWYPITPGHRPIPQRGPDTSMTDLRRSTATEDHHLSGPFQDVPALPPPLPPRSVNGDSTPSTPARASRNFSYPTKQDSTSWGNIPPLLRPGQQGQKDTGTIANLKMAAAGLHGAGEALRGTISQSAERHLGMGKASEAKMLKAQEVINKGKYEIENRRFAPQEVRVVPGRKPVPVYPQKTPQPVSAQPQTLTPQHSAQLRPSSPQPPFAQLRTSSPQPPFAQPRTNTPQPTYAQPQPTSAQPQPSTPQPDGYPTHMDVSRRRFSTGYSVQPLKPKEEEPPPEKGGISKWLRKARSHPSDKGKDSSLRDHDRPSDGEGAKLKKRSKILNPVAE